MLYKMPTIISIDAIYSKILQEITRMYRFRNKDEQITISLVDTVRIDSNALLIFVGLLNKLKDRCNKPIYLDLLYNPRLLGFLDSVRFFEILSRLNIIEYDEDLIGGFSDVDFNFAHRINYHNPISDYEEILDEKKELFRDEYSNNLRMHVRYKYIKSIENLQLSDQDMELIEITVSEIVLNAQLYSGSYCYDYLQTGIKFADGKKGIIFSVVDVGKGFRQSLAEKISKGFYYTEDKIAFDNRVKKLGIDRRKFGDFITIMEVLYFSQIQPRDINLYYLKETLAVSHANFRIHYNTTQIIFTYEKCCNCTNRSILNCLECSYTNAINQPIASKRSIKIYPIALAGVHIEVEFIREENKCLKS